MKKYPKVPRYDHPALEGENLWGAEDLSLLEKMDGQNYRFFLYDDAYGYYVREVDNNPNFRADFDKSEISNGDIVFGTKNVFRGTTNMKKSNVGNKYHRAYEKLNNIDKDCLKEIQDKEGPIILFAEHMIHHSMKQYYHGENTAPALIGFDIYKPGLDDRENYSANPYEEKFIGFLSLDKSKEIFEEIGVTFTNIIGGENIDSFEDVDDYNNFVSLYADTAEGVVFRSDSLKLRAKKTSEYFQEINKKYWGMNKDEADNGEQYIVASFVTTPRVRKIFNKIRNKNLDYNDVSKMVWDDIWEEEVEEIKQLDLKLNPYNMIDLIVNRCEGEMEKVIENSRLTSSHQDLEVSNVNELDLIINVDSLEVDSDNVEQWIIDNYVSVDFIFEVANKEFEEVKRDNIDSIYRKVNEYLWYKYNEDLRRINSYFNPSELNPLIAKKCAKNIHN